MTIKKLVFILTIVLVFFSCKKEPNPISVEQTAPKIQFLSATKDTILFGGNDPTEITCSASGGNLNYEWQVDLGSIVPLTTDKSKIQFTASDCCLGEKLIFCTVSNEMGSATDTIQIYILL